MKLIIFLATFVAIIFRPTGGQEFESSEEDDSLLPPLISLSPSLRPTPPPPPSSSCIYEGVVCPLTVDNVIDIDSSSVAETPSTCQYMCFREQLCQNFTFFQNSAGETRLEKFYWIDPKSRSELGPNGSTVQSVSSEFKHTHQHLPSSSRSFHSSLVPS